MTIRVSLVEFGTNRKGIGGRGEMRIENVVMVIVGLCKVGSGVT